MDLVVVYLTNVHEHVIVPEHYIYDLNVKSLKNKGKNPCRDYLVYWSDECVEGEHYPEPNSDATISMNFPAGSGAWFHGRTVYFTGTYTL